MTDKQIEKFFHLIQKNKYEPQLINYGTSNLKKNIFIKSKGFLAPEMLISFTDFPCSKGEDFLTDAEALNKQLNNSKLVCIIIVVSSNDEIKDNFWFNGNFFVHIVTHNDMNNCLCFEKDFHYFGAKYVRNLIYLLNQTVSENKADDTVS